MHVRVVDREVSSPRVQDAEESHPPRPHELLLGSQLDDGLTGCIEECRIAGSLVRANATAQRLRHREGDQEVVRRQQFAHPGLQPALRLLLLTVRVVAVATTTTYPMRSFARITFVVQVTQRTRPTTGDECQHTFVLDRHPMTRLARAELLKVRFAMLA